MKTARNPAASKEIMLPYQVRWLADEAPVKVAEKSRRVGITWTEAADSALRAAAAKGMDTWYIGYNRDMALEFVETAAQWAPVQQGRPRDRGDSGRRRTARYPRLPGSFRVRPEDRRAFLAAVEPARQTGARRNR